MLSIITLNIYSQIKNNFMKNKNEENILTASNPQSYYSNFISKEEGLKKIIEGINYASDIVGSTLGSAGKNALLQTQYPHFI